MTEYKKILIRLTDKQDEVLAKRAKKFGVSKSFLIRKAISEYIARGETNTLELKGDESVE